MRKYSGHCSLSIWIECYRSSHQTHGTHSHYSKYSTTIYAPTVNFASTKQIIYHLLIGTIYLIEIKFNIIDNLKNGRFHQHLRDTFAPLVVRYVDLMESSIAQSIHKGFEKERWESKGNGCATSEDLFWKLDALQSFIRDLHWPDEEFREHLEQRLKLMACEMIESCIQRTDGAYQSWLKKSVTFISTDYIIPSEMCAMVNVILDAKNQSFKLCAVDGIDRVSTHKIDKLRFIRKFLI